MADTIQWLTTQEAAERACCGVRALRGAVRSGRLQAARAHGELRFLERWIDEYQISAYAIQADVAYIFLRDEYTLAAERLSRAVAEAYQAGYLGKNIQGWGLDFDMRIKMGAGAFVCGEETALMASIEGERGMPRPRPRHRSRRPPLHLHPSGWYKKTFHHYPRVGTFSWVPSGLHAGGSGKGTNARRIKNPEWEDPKQCPTARAPSSP